MTHDCGEAVLTDGRVPDQVPDRAGEIGLTAAQVAAAIQRGQTNAVVAIGRRTLDIIRDNTLTRFNALLGTLLVIALVVAPPQDALFGFVLLANSIIGIALELRAKRTLDRLTVLAMPMAIVVRRRPRAADRRVRGRAR